MKKDEHQLNGTYDEWRNKTSNTKYNTEWDKLNKCKTIELPDRFIKAAQWHKKIGQTKTYGMGR